MMHTDGGAGHTVDRVGDTVGPHQPRDDLIVAADGRHYMRRHHLDTHTRIHELLVDDPGRDYHDHPWDYTTRILHGSYREHTPAGTTDHHPGAVLHRRAEQPHRLELLDGPVLTLFVAGPVRRRWGFHTDHGWVHWRDYDEAGHIEAAP